MEVAVLNEGTIKIKTKKTSLVVDPSSLTPKVSADCILSLTKGELDQQKVNDFRLVVDGPGEYEVGGVKISASSIEGKNIYSFTADGVNILVGKTSTLKKLVEKLIEHKVAIFCVDQELEENVLTAVEPSVVFLYGEKFEDAVKALGKDLSLVEKTKKVSINESKLSEEMQVYILQ